MIRFILTGLALVALAFTISSCKSKEGTDGRASKLEMSSDSPACVAAIKCCEAKVKLDKKDATAEDYNLSCSGVAMATTDEECGAFKKGYAGVFESKSIEVPAVCK